MANPIEAWSLAYVFPHESLFVWTIGALIVGLVALRLYLSCRHRNPGR